MNSPDLESDAAGVALSQQESAAAELVNAFLLESTVQQNVNTLLQYFQLAYFLRKISGMSKEEFDTLCTDTRRLIAKGIGDNNKKLQSIPDPVRTRAQRAGVLPDAFDVVNAMRYFGEAKKLLLAIRDGGEEV